MDSNALKLLSRAELQKLAKENQIKANLKSDIIIELLVQRHPVGVPRATPKTRRSKRNAKHAVLGTNKSRSPAAKLQVSAELQAAASSRSIQVSTLPLLDDERRADSATANSIDPEHVHQPREALVNPLAENAIPANIVEGAISNRDISANVTGTIDTGGAAVNTRASVTIEDAKLQQSMILTKSENPKKNKKNKHVEETGYLDDDYVSSPERSDKLPERADDADIEHVLHMFRAVADKNRDIKLEITRIQDFAAKIRQQSSDARTVFRGVLGNQKRIESYATYWNSISSTWPHESLWGSETMRVNYRVENKGVYHEEVPWEPPLENLPVSAALVDVVTTLRAAERRIDPPPLNLADIATTHDGAEKVREEADVEEVQTGHTRSREKRKRSNDEDDRAIDDEERYRGRTRTRNSTRFTSVAVSSGSAPLPHAPSGSAPDPRNAALALLSPASNSSSSIVKPLLLPAVQGAALDPSLTTSTNSVPLPSSSKRLDKGKGKMAPEDVEKMEREAAATRRASSVGPLDTALEESHLPLTRQEAEIGMALAILAESQHAERQAASALAPIGEEDEQSETAVAAVQAVEAAEGPAPVPVEARPRRTSRKPSRQPEAVVTRQGRSRGKTPQR